MLLDAKPRKDMQRSWNKRSSNCTRSLSRCALVNLRNSVQKLKTDTMASDLTGFAMSRTVAEQEVLKLRKELSDANAKLKNAANAVALEAEQRANSKVSHLASQYESRCSELKGNLEADCKKIVDETVEYARQGMEGFKQELSWR